MLSTSPYKGTRDFYPEDMRFRRWMFGKIEEVCRLYGYEEVLGPLIEPFELYAAKTGEEIVNQQLYHFMDRGERKVALRPEFTPTLARMVAAKASELPKPIRWYSIAGFHRYERPQRGRLREFWQLNVDLLGGEVALADAEIVELPLRIVEAFGGLGHCKMFLNHRGIVDEFFAGRLGLTAEIALAVTKAIDAREKIGEEAFQSKLTELGLTSSAVSQITKFLGASLKEMETLAGGSALDSLAAVVQALKERGFGSDFVEFKPSVLRGLDYYTGIVFELYDVSPENHRAMLGGGRYDNLVGMFGVKPPISGVGLGMGDVTFENFLRVHSLVPDQGRTLDAFVSIPADSFRVPAAILSEELRRVGLSTILALEVSGFGAQLKLASKQGARFAVLFGDQEWKGGEVVLKDLKSGEQKAVKLEKVAGAIRDGVSK